jgi:hypothetical protein
MKLDLANLNERERRMVLIGGVAAVVLLLFGIVVPLETSVSKAQDRIEKKQADLQWMRTVGPELANAGPAITRPATQESMLVIVDRAARESGLGNSLVNSEPTGQGGLRVNNAKGFSCHDTLSSRTFCTDRPEHDPSHTVPASSAQDTSLGMNPATQLTGRRATRMAANATIASRVIQKARFIESAVRYLR